MLMSYFFNDAFRIRWTCKNVVVRSRKIEWFQNGYISDVGERIVALGPRVRAAQEFLSFAITFVQYNSETSRGWSQSGSILSEWEEWAKNAASVSHRNCLSL